MQKLIFFLFMCLAVKFCQGQQNENDSLLAALKLHPAEDTVRFSLLNDLAFNYQFSNPDLGIKMADEAIALSKKINNNKALAGAYSSKAMNLLAKSEDSLALNLYTSAMEVHKKINNELGIARVYNNMAIVYVNRSEYAKALDCHTNSFAIFKKLNDSARMASSLTNRGVVYQYLADYPKSLGLYFQALSLFEKLGKTNDIAYTFTNIGIIYKNLEKYPLSLEYHTKALAIYENSVNLQGKANALGNIGVTYDSWDNPVKALKFYQQALEINQGIGNKNRIASDLTNIGTAYKKLKDNSQAITYLNKAIANYKQTDDKNSLAIALNTLGDILLSATDEDLRKAGIAPKHRFAKALVLQQESLQLGVEIESPDRQASTWHSLSETYEAKGEYRKALEAFKKSQLLQDSIFSDEKAAEIARKELQFKYDRDLAVLKAQHDGEIKQQQIMRRNTIGWGAGALVAATIIFISYKKRRDAVQQKNEAVFKTKVADTEMKVLRLQMNPHFIFNSLNSISDYISKNDMKAADTYLSKFAKVMRMTLENSEKKTVTLAEDLKNLELYMQLEAQRLNNKFTYEIKIDSHIDQDNTLVPPMIFQPFVENSIWHGMIKKEEQGHIIVDIRKQGEMINCMIDDNGVGRQLQETIAGEVKTSFGMKITNARIEILNKLKGSNASIQLIDKPQGVRAELNLPLQLNF